MKHLTDLIFPVLFFDRLGKVYAPAAISALTYTNLTTWRHKLEINAFIIDSTGKRYRIIKRRIAKLLPPYFFILFLDPTFQADYDLDEPEQLQIDEIKELTLSSFAKEGIRKKKLLTKIRDAMSFSEITDAVRAIGDSIEFAASKNC